MVAGQSHSEIQMEQEAASSPGFTALRFFGDDDDAAAAAGGGFLRRRGEVRRNGAADGLVVLLLAADAVGTVIKGDATTLAARDAITVARVAGLLILLLLTVAEERRGGIGGVEGGSVAAERRKKSGPGTMELEIAMRRCCSGCRANNDANVVEGGLPAAAALWCSAING